MFSLDTERSRTGARKRGEIWLAVVVTQSDVQVTKHFFVRLRISTSIRGKLNGVFVSRGQHDPTARIVSSLADYARQFEAVQAAHAEPTDMVYPYSLLSYVGRHCGCSSRQSTKKLSSSAGKIACTNMTYASQSK